MLASDPLTIVEHFGGQLNAGSAVRCPVKRSRVVIHGNGRLFLLLMVNVEVPVSDQLSINSGGGSGAAGQLGGIHRGCLQHYVESEWKDPGLGLY